MSQQEEQPAIVPMDDGHAPPALPVGGSQGGHEAGQEGDVRQEPIRLPSVEGSDQGDEAALPVPMQDGSGDPCTLPRPMPVHRRPGVWIGLSLWLLAAILWRVDSSHPAHTIAQAMPVPAASTNAFWGGYVATQGGPYTAVQASWTIPPISCSQRSPARATTYVWVGEGGYLQGLASPLIQAGTGSDCLSSVPRYHAFYEWYPGIYATDFPVAVQPGDAVTVRLQETQPDFWLLSFQDDTSGARSTTAVPYHADMGSADFIVERPNVCDLSGCQQLALGKFDPIIFGNARTQSAGQMSFADLSSALPIALVDQSSDHQLALPARAGSRDGSLSVIWRKGW